MDLSLGKADTAAKPQVERALGNEPRPFNAFCDTRTANPACTGRGSGFEMIVAENKKAQDKAHSDALSNRTKRLDLERTSF